MKKRLLSALLALCMMLTMAPVAFAAGNTLTVSDEATLRSAINSAQNGDTIQLTSDIAITAPIVVANKTITLNLAGHTISAASQIWNESDGHWSLIEAAAGSDLTITGNGKLQTIENDTYAIDLINGGKCTIENGEIIGNVHAVYVLEGELTVNGGTFSVQQVFSQNQPYQFVLNCYDASYKNGTAKITVNGGSFVGFNPRNCEAEGKGTNFCSAGCKVAVDSTNDPATYTVTKVNEGEMIVVPEQSGTNEVSASLEGTFTSSTENVTTTSPDGSQAAGENQPSGDVADNTVTVTLPAVSNATTASLNVAGDTVSSLADNSGSLTIKSDVGNLEVNNAALKTISDNASGTVTLSIENKTATGTTDTATYELTAKDAGGNDVFTESNGSVKVSVPKPTGISDNNVFVYYLSPKGAEKVEGAKVEGENVVWNVNHFSTYYITAAEQKIYVKDEDGNTTATYATLQEAIDKASAGDTIMLMSDVTVNAPSQEKTGAITIEKNITLDGGGNTISIGTGFAATGGSGWDADLGKYHVLNILSGATIQNLTIDGGWDGTETSGDPSYSAARSGINIWNTNSTQLDVELKNVTVKNCSVYAVTAKGADLTITNLTTSGNQWGVNVEDNSTVTIENSEIDEDIVYESSSTTSSLDINGGTYGTVKTQGTSTAGNVQITGNANVEKVENGSGTSTNVAVSGSTVGTLTNNGTGAMSAVNCKLNNVPQKNVTLVGCVDKNEEPIADQLETGIVAIYKGKEYSALATALTDAETNGGNVLLVANADLTSAVPEDTCLQVLSGKTLKADLTGSEASTILSSKGTIAVDYGGVLSVKSQPSGNFVEMIGDQDANINLTNGYIEIGFDSALTLDFFGATAEVPTSSRWTLKLATYSMNVTLDDSSTLTVNSTGDGTEDDGFRVANGSTLTNNGTIEVNGIMSISSEGKVDGSGTITVDSNGVLVVNKSDSGDSVGTLDNAVANSGTFVWNGSTGTPNKTITLASGGKVYSNANIADKLSGEETMSNKTYDGTAYSYAWQYDVPSSSSGGGSSSSSYTVSVASGIDNGKVTVSPKSASKGDTVTITVTPDEGYELDTLTVTDKNGDKISVTDKGNGKYTFTMPSGKVTIDAAFAEAAETPDQVGPFEDVSTDDWFADAVQYMLDNGMMNGVTENTFAPNTTTTRGMIVTMLHRLEGEPSAAVSSFTDVAADAYYGDAVAWAAANSIVNGMSDTIFAPNNAITREQMAAILYRYAQYKGYDTSVGGMSLAEYTDADQISSYATTAMQWANENGLITGRTDTTLVPQGTATRAEVATILMRFCENIAK